MRTAKRVVVTWISIAAFCFLATVSPQAANAAASYNDSGEPSTDVCHRACGIAYDACAIVNNTGLCFFLWLDCKNRCNGSPAPPIIVAGSCGPQRPDFGALRLEGDHDSRWRPAA